MTAYVVAFDLLTCLEYAAIWAVNRARRDAIRLPFSWFVQAHPCMSLKG